MNYSPDVLYVFPVFSRDDRTFVSVMVNRLLPPYFVEPFGKDNVLAITDAEDEIIPIDEIKPFTDANVKSAMSADWEELGARMGLWVDPRS